MTNAPIVKGFFDAATFTISYVVADPETGVCAVIDSLLDFDQASGRTSTSSADLIIEYIQQEGLTLDWIIDTHVHADHLTAAAYIKSKLGGRTGISAHISEVQRVFAKLFNEDQSFHTDGSQFDHLFAEDEAFKIGNLEAVALYTPGHTAACVSYLIADAVFVGDTLFMPDYGTARCDFPGGDAGRLYDSIQRLFALSDKTRVFLCHDYKGPGRDEFVWETTVGVQKRENIHLKDGITRDAFIALRNTRDAGLGVPKLILPSVQINIRAGEMPPPEDNGQRYMKIPINAL